MRVKLQKGTEEWSLFTDFWKLTQDLWGIEDTETYWQGVRSAVEAFASKYGAFGIDLSVALMKELKRRSENHA